MTAIATMTQPVVLREARAQSMPYGAVAREVAGMARCGRCKAARRVTLIRVTWTGGVDGCGNPKRYSRIDYPDVTCCGKVAGIRPLVAVHNEAVRCGGKCTSAKGHDCECSCGGENHGRDHG